MDGYSLENQVMYKSWVESLGGAYTGDLSGTSTHLIVPDAKGELEVPASPHRRTLCGLLRGACPGR